MLAELAESDKVKSQLVVSVDGLGFDEECSFCINERRIRLYIYER